MLNVSVLEQEYEKVSGYSDICAQLSETAIAGYTPMWLNVKAIEQDRVVTAKLRNSLPDETRKAVEALVQQSQGAIATGGCKSLDNSSISCYNGCGGCKSCMPKDAKQNMGELWEVVQHGKTGMQAEIKEN